MNWTTDGDDPESYRWRMSPASHGALDAGAQQGPGVWLTPNFMLSEQFFESSFPTT